MHERRRGNADFEEGRRFGLEQAIAFLQIQTAVNGRPVLRGEADPKSFVSAFTALASLVAIRALHDDEDPTVAVLAVKDDVEALGAELRQLRAAGFN